MICHRPDDAAAWVLRALDEAEAESFREHLEGCAGCRSEVAFLQPAVDVLPLGVEQLAPPPALKSRIMAEVEREAELLRAAGPEADRVPTREPAKRRRFWNVRPVPAFALACTLIFLGIFAGAMVADDDPATRSVMAQVTGPGRAQLVVTGNHGQLRLDGVRQPPKGSVYQVWLKLPDRKDPVPSRTLFNVRRDGTARVDIQEDVHAAEQILVTVEPDGGSTAPTSSPTIVATPS